MEVNNYQQFKLNTFKVKKWKDELIFLHQLTGGVAESSYGIEVAKMAGLPEGVVDEARKILNRLEQNFSPNNNITKQENINFNKEEKHFLLENIEKKIKNLNLDNLTPLEALNLLKEMKDKIEEKNW